MHKCKALDIEPHCKKYAAMTVITYGPSGIMSELEKACIDQCSQGLRPGLLHNVAKGGERIGKGYDAFLYVCFNNFDRACCQCFWCESERADLADQEF
jgi:hypothetical protein